MKQRQVGYQWNLRQVMATRGLFSTTDLQPLLVERGVELSAAQVYRLVTSAPERLNMRVLAAVCDALDCTPNDLIEPTAGTIDTPVRATRQTGGRGGGQGAEPGPAARPTRVRVVPPSL